MKKALTLTLLKLTALLPSRSANYGHCLQNKPTHNLLDEDKDDVAKLPGEYFDENKQCEFVFGHGSKICSYMVSE